MFDYLFCEYPLPLPEEAKNLKADFAKGVKAPINWSEFEFQTKDFGGNLEKYTIEEDGQIYKEIINREVVEGTDGTIEMVEKSDGIEKISHTGEVIFYGLHLDDDNDYWVEFTALFWKGELKEISLNEWSVESNKERKEAQERLSQTIKKMTKTKSKWWFPFYKLYFMIVSFFLGLIKYFLGFFLKLVWKAEKWMLK